MKPLYAIITHNNRVSHVEEYDDDTVNNMLEYIKRCVNRELTVEEVKQFKEDWYLYIELDHDNIYSFEMYHPEC